MAANRKDVDRWISYAKENKIKYIISVCDTFDWDDYPVYCETIEKLKVEIPSHQRGMQKINEIIMVDGEKVTENLSPIDFI